jgi:hypothetical protein
MLHATRGREGTLEAAAFITHFYSLSMVWSFHEFGIRSIVADHSMERSTGSSAFFRVAFILRISMLKNARTKSLPR